MAELGSDVVAMSKEPQCHKSKCVEALWKAAQEGGRGSYVQSTLWTATFSNFTSGHSGLVTPTNHTQGKGRQVCTKLKCVLCMPNMYDSYSAEYRSSYLG